MTEAAQFDLVCKVCDQLLEDPHLTPCCMKSFCLKHFNPSLSSSSISCPACGEQFAPDKLAPDNRRKGKVERSKLTAENSQKSQYLTEVHQTSSLGKNSNFKQRLQNVFTKVRPDIAEQTPNFQKKSNFQRDSSAVRNTNRNVGGHIGNPQHDFNSNQCQTNENSISDGDFRRDNICSDCLKKTQCTFCQHHSVEERLHNIISDISLLETEASRRTHRMKLITDARSALSEKFAASSVMIEDSQKELSKLARDIKLKAEKMETAIATKKIFEEDQRKVVLKIKRELNDLENKRIPSVNVERILMVH
ncbi:unnamed protein product [Rodentolepis nana]|uniref:RING-type domain-containing protein n=1 Tax=Rodentolepis nana TaxID=102285 RepID=A0A0R3TSC5_RODNA|nr:unnamed protein product [Rodentolepis nana]